MINKFRYKKPTVRREPQSIDVNDGDDDHDEDDMLVKMQCAKHVTTTPRNIRKAFVCDTTSTTTSSNKAGQDYNRTKYNNEVKYGDIRDLFHELFSQLQFSTETALPPDVLRRALAESFFDQNRFQLGFMDDAAECFENILLRIHAHIAEGASEDMCDAKHCVPHRKFAMTLVEQTACCGCGATSEPLSYTQMVHYVSTSSLVYQVRANVNNGVMPFGQLLLKAGNMGDIRTCPSSCGDAIQIRQTLMNRPEIISIGLVWNSERPTLEHIMEVFSSIGTTVKLSDIFSSVVDSRWAETAVHNLVGVVTYYGKHYSTFFFHTKLRVWIYFDDATVREIGPRWEQVVEKCHKGRYQPLLLLYALPDGTPVNTENAPKIITPLYSNNKVTKKPPTQSPAIRRSVTPSPEKPVIGTSRRAITPNPEISQLNQKPSLTKLISEYQNLSIIQKNLSQAHHNGELYDSVSKSETGYNSKKHISIQRTLSNGSSSGIEMSIPEHVNGPRRRDSGNWSGDRNSASSASSTTMDNPYLYLIGKVPQGMGSVPASPTRLKSDSSSGSSGVYDAGYDSHSLSSNDSSSMSTLQHLIKMGHLAKIPEDYNATVNPTTQSCDVLCDEADELLVKSRQLEDEHDLVLALALCNAAATKARAAMNAPYNNPQTLTLARMKHNTCIMRARSLHRRMTQTQTSSKDTPPEIRHTREGSSGSGRHSRQNSKDKTGHSRQNSRELLVMDKESKPALSKIEIYATLPKKRDVLKNKFTLTSAENDSDKVQANKPNVRESRSIFSRSKNKDTKIKDKRSRSEDRNKISTDFSIAPEIPIVNDTVKPVKDEKDDRKDNKDNKSKKQHKIRRKLLMGGLIKRKNRSMPDLTDANVEVDPKIPTTTLDDSNIGLSDTSENRTNMSGYLSEGHLEYVGNNTNPNLERSKLMRKSFHSSAGKILTVVAKVPPPPPLRTSSQLSTSKFNVVGDSCNVHNMENHFAYNSDSCGGIQQDYHHYSTQAPSSLPHFNNSMSDESFYSSSPNTIITHADVHQETSVCKTPTSEVSESVDEVDCLPSHGSFQNLELPPYPSPLGSVIHSRQSSGDFPPPPPPLDLSVLNEHLNPQPNSLLIQLQKKRQQILSQDIEIIPQSQCMKSGDTWLKELQAKQAALRTKSCQSNTIGKDVVNTQRNDPDESKIESVKDLASKFENIDSNCYNPLSKCESNNGLLSMKKRRDHRIPSEQISKEIEEVNMLNAQVQRSFNSDPQTEEYKKQLTKKKSVSFCDQVILVATADEQEDDSYIPNPILERVLRTAMNKPEASALKQEILALRGGDLAESSNSSEQIIETNNNKQITRRNSLENVLSDQDNLMYKTVQRFSPAPSPTMNQYNGQMPPQQIDPHANQYKGGQMNEYGNAMQNCNTVQNTTCCQYNQYPSAQYAPNEIYMSRKVNYPFDAQYNNNMQPPVNHCPAGYYYTDNNCTATPPSPYQHLPENSPAMLNYYAAANACKPHNVGGYPPQFPIETANPSPINFTPNYPAQPCTMSYSKSFPKTQVPTTTQHRLERPQDQPVCDRVAQENAYPTYGMHPAHVDDAFYQKKPHYGQQPQYQKQQHENSPYLRVPMPPDLHQIQPYCADGRNEIPTSYDNSPQYTRNQIYPVHNPKEINQNNNRYYRGAQRDCEQQQYNNCQQPGPYQRVPPPHCNQEVIDRNKLSPYQPIPVSAGKYNLKKSVSFEPGTKGGGSAMDTPQLQPKAVVTPIIVNNANNSIPTDRTKCNLCRKKNVVASNLYCQDCEFYMSRFKPIT